MKSKKPEKNWMGPAAVRFAIAIVLVTGIAACAHAMMMSHGVKKPAESEFGLGPRQPAEGRYVATLQPEQPLRVRNSSGVMINVLRFIRVHLNVLKKLLHPKKLQAWCRGFY